MYDITKATAVKKDDETIGYLLQLNEPYVLNNELFKTDKPRTVKR